VHDPLRHRILFREVNERIREINVEFGLGAGNVQVFCECARGDCLERIEVPGWLYERVRGAAQFLIAPGHQAPGSERVVEAGSGYLVVA
jgi:hypothetical protein